MCRLSLLTLLTVGLFTSGVWAEKAPVSIRGIITDMGAKAFLVEGKKEADTEHDKAMVKLQATTKILRAEGELLKPAKVEDLKKGVRVEITFEGPVAESYPVQAKAGKIVILPAEDNKTKEDKKPKEDEKK